MAGSLGVNAGRISCAPQAMSRSSHAPTRTSPSARPSTRPTWRRAAPPGRPPTMTRRAGRSRIDLSGKAERSFALNPEGGCSMYRRLQDADRARHRRSRRRGRRVPDADPAIVRVIWALLALLTGGVFFVLYIVMWIVVPEGPRRRSAPGGAPPAIDPATGQPVPATRTWSAQPVHRHRRGSGAGRGRRADPDRPGLILLVRDDFRQITNCSLIGLVALGVLLLLVAMRRRAVVGGRHRRRRAGRDRRVRRRPREREHGAGASFAQSALISGRRWPVGGLGNVKA